MRAAVVFFVCCGLLGLDGTWAQKPSPCPKVFAYKPSIDGIINTWTGVITIKSDEGLEGIWFNFSLDTPANVLLNWFGESTSKNNKDFQVRNLNYIVKPNEILLVMIQIIYDAAGRIPSLTKIVLNGKVICRGPKRYEDVNLTRKRTTTTEAPRIPIVEDISPGATRRGPDFFIGEVILLDSSIDTNLSDITDNVQCGTKVEKPISLITNGQPVNEEGEWPWHVAIYTSGLRLGYTCGGSLLNEDYVITAAHCVTEQNTRILNGLDTFMIQFGKTQLSKFSPNSQVRGLSKITIHPDYDPKYFHNDLAVLKLSKPVEFTDFVRPVCLWDDGPNVSVVGKLGSVVGWGLTENLTISDILQEVKMPVVDTLTCIYSKTDFFSKVTTPKTLCAGFKNGTSVCNGDSGGGMVFPKSTSIGGVIWQLRGLVSVSSVLRKRYCDPFNYVVFTDVAHFTNWIMDNIV